MNGPYLAPAARRLAQAAVTGEVVAAVRGWGVCPLLIKGPVLERWLCRDGIERRYGDVDLVVTSDQFVEPEAALADLGFVQRLAASAHVGLSDHEHE